ncbi:hypothetical protein [Bacillus sp. RAR_GA_16]|uniref:hypothetical protein n=1 Tax=Bacillus sp. RAR_GA_16 TaxID=2876774 RepID=UPI001CD00C4C|nr:hypothetical protein [Bacillus sp. RAR_GA_16]MCA0172413.1 hypothetical protein [Bacillus sp. RAR_GA_16]
MYATKTKVKGPEQHKRRLLEIGWIVNKQGGTGRYDKEKERLNQMIIRFFTFLIGFGLSVAGGVTLILELNLIIIGHSLLEYFAYISKTPELYLFVSGVAIVWVSVYWPRL